MNRTPIPLEHLAASERRPPEDGQWRLVQACRLIQKKGILTTLKALAIVKQQYPRVRYVICGEGPLKPKIEESVQKRGLEDNVELLGWLDQHQRVSPPRPHLAQDQPQQAVRWAESPLRSREHTQLVAQSKAFE